MSEKQSSDSVRKVLEKVKAGQMSKFTAEDVARAIVGHRQTLDHITSYVERVRNCTCWEDVRKPVTENAEILVKSHTTSSTSSLLVVLFKDDFKSMNTGNVVKMIKNRMELEKVETELGQFVETCICKLKEKFKEGSDGGNRGSDFIDEACRFIETVLNKCKDARQRVVANEVDKAIEYLRDHEKHLRYYKERVLNQNQNEKTSEASGPRGVNNHIERNIIELKEKLSERKKEADKYRQQYEDLMKERDQGSRKKDSRHSSDKEQTRNETIELEKKLQRKSERINKLEESERLLKIENNDLKNRLSVIAGQKMTENNPDIADLGDPFRPTSLVEKFRLIYDEEWTLAFENLEKEMKDSQIVECLSSILQNVDAFCGEASVSQLTDLETCALQIITAPKFRKLSSSFASEVSIEEGKIASRNLNDLRKALATVSVKPLINIYGRHVMPSLKIKATAVKKPTQHINDFIEKSLRIIWLMKVQNPPMALAWQRPGDSFDKARFVHYTKKGDRVAYSVWPAVLLHDNGPLMGKGVAQGC